MVTIRFGKKEEPAAPIGTPPMPVIEPPRFFSAYELQTVALLKELVADQKKIGQIIDEIRGKLIVE